MLSFTKMAPKLPPNFITFSNTCIDILTAQYISDMTPLTSKLAGVLILNSAVKD